MTAADDPNLRSVGIVARHLGSLREEVAFLGGAAASLLVTDPASGPVRPTTDVDVIVEVASLAAYQAKLGAGLRRRGFSVDTSEGAPVCRWVVEGVRVDVMPTDGAILGFSNRWYPAALRHAAAFDLPGGPRIRLVTAPLFLATKVEAFRGRGVGDYAASRDIEDLVAVVDGRRAITDETEAAPPDVRAYLRDAVAALLRTDAFLDALPGHLYGDPASQARLSLVVDRLGRIAGHR